VVRSYTIKEIAEALEIMSHLEGIVACEFSERVPSRSLIWGRSSLEKGDDIFARVSRLLWRNERHFPRAYPPRFRQHHSY